MKTQRFSAHLCTVTAGVIALGAAVLLGLVIYVIRTRAMLPTRFPRAVWAVVAYCALGIIANAAKPSPAERRLWLPVVCTMFLSSLIVARRPRPRVPTEIA